MGNKKCFTRFLFSHFSELANWLFNCQLMYDLKWVIKNVLPVFCGSYLKKRGPGYIPAPFPFLCASQQYVNKILFTKPNFKLRPPFTLFNFC
jgi:hypothetical protein